MTSTDIYVPDRFRRAIVAHVGCNQLAEQIGHYPLILGIHGPPGTGKTFQCEHVLQALQGHPFPHAGTRRSAPAQAGRGRTAHCCNSRSGSRWRLRFNPQPRGCRCRHSRQSRDGYRCRLASVVSRCTLNERDLFKQSSGIPLVPIF